MKPSYFWKADEKESTNVTGTFLFNHIVNLLNES